MYLNFGVYNSTVYASQLESKNGLFSALVLIGISRDEDILDCNNADSRYLMLVERYNAQQLTLGRCNRGKNHICRLLSDKGIRIRKRKCMNYVATQKGRRFYSDILITDFAKTVLQEIDHDPALSKALIYVLSSKCDSYTSTANLPKVNDCVQHIFGFQYEILREIVAKRAHPNSRKSRALSNTLETMRGLLSSAGYPSVHSKPNSN